MYAVYMRVSKDELNIENQRFELNKYIKDNNLEVYDYYEDKITGAKKARPDLDRLMKDARERKFNHVLFWKVDRLGRSTLHMLQVVEEWENLGINFTITTLNIDTSTPIGKFTFGLLAQVAELEREFIKQRTNSAMSRIQDDIKKKGFYITKKGKKITKLGRPKGKIDSEPRKKRGYLLRDYKKRTPRKKAEFYNKEVKL